MIRSFRGLNAPVRRAATVFAASLAALIAMPAAAQFAASSDTSDSAADLDDRLPTERPRRAKVASIELVEKAEAARAERVAHQKREKLGRFLEAVKRHEEAKRAEAERIRQFAAAVERHEAAQRAEAKRAAERAAEKERARERAREQERHSQAAAPRRSGGGSRELSGLRNCESGGDYGAVSSSGRYRGAYQFSRSTWDSVAASNAPHLVGTDPAAASPGDQDAMANALYRSSGRSPWPVCGRHI